MIAFYVDANFEGFHVELENSNKIVFFDETLTNNLNSMYPSQCVLITSHLFLSFLDNERGDTFEITTIGNLMTPVYVSTEELCSIRDCSLREEEIIGPGNNDFFSKYET